MAKGIRVNQLARELGVESKAILARCRDEGLADKVVNHMSMISIGLAEFVREWFASGGGASTAVETPPPVEVAIRPKRPIKKKKTEFDDVGSAERAVSNSTGAPSAARISLDSRLPDELIQQILEAQNDFSDHIKNAKEAKTDRDRKRELRSAVKCQTSVSDAFIEGLHKKYSVHGLKKPRTGGSKVMNELEVLCDFASSRTNQSITPYRFRYRDYRNKTTHLLHDTDVTQPSTASDLMTEEDGITEFFKKLLKLLRKAASGV